MRGSGFIRWSAIAAAVIASLAVPSVAFAHSPDDAAPQRLDPPPGWEEERRIAGARHADPAPGFLETSEYFIGSVSVSVLFLESTGAIDADTEDWSPAQKSLALQKVQTALDWWASQEPRAGISFVTEWIEEVPISYEPITRSTDDDGLWIAEAMEYLDFPREHNFSNGRFPYLGAAYEYVNDLRARHGTDWAFTIFMVNDVNDPDHAFADGPASIAYALLGGPYVVMPYYNDNWGPQNMHRSVAHEIGHIFYATDTYDNQSDQSGYFNAQDRDGQVGLMNESNLTLPSSTRLQIGWRDSDGDGILDPVDTTPQVSLQVHGPGLMDQTTLEYTGAVTEAPLTNQNSHGLGRSVSINAIESVAYRLDGGPWREASPVDGSFDSPWEAFSFTVSDLTVGQHTIQVWAANSVLNPVAQYAVDGFTTTLIIIDQGEVSAARAGVGTPQSLRLHLAWAHDDSPVGGGAVAIGDAPPQITDASGWATFPLSSTEVGVVSLEVTSARSGGISRFDSPAETPSIVWDRVRATAVDVSDAHVDRGALVNIFVRAELEYDGTPLAETDSLEVAGRVAVWDVDRGAFRID